MVTLMKLEAELVFPSSNKLESEELRADAQFLRPQVYSSECSSDVCVECLRLFIGRSSEEPDLYRRRTDGLSASQVKDAAKLRQFTAEARRRTRSLATAAVQLLSGLN